MPTPEIHAADTAISVISFTTITSFVLETSGLSGGAIFCAVMVAVYAIARNSTYTRWQALMMLVGSVGSALIFTAIIAKLIHYLFGLELPLQGLSSAIAFIFIDKSAKDWVLGFFSKKVQDLEVKK